MSKLLVAAFSWFERTFSKPAIGGTFVILLMVWMFLSVVTPKTQTLLLCNGAGRLFGCAWDQGALYGNAFQNLFQVIVLLATMSIAFAIRSSTHQHHSTLHEKLDALRKAVEALGEEDETS